MYLAYDRDGNEALMRGRQVFSTHHGRWQTHDQFNSTLDGTKAYNLTKQLGQTLNATLAAPREDLSQLNKTVAEVREQVKQVAKPRKTYPYNESFLVDAVSKGDRFGFFPVGRGGASIEPYMVTNNDTNQKAVRGLLRLHFKQMGIGRKAQESMPSSEQLKLAIASYQSSQRTKAII